MSGPAGLGSLVFVQTNVAEVVNAVGALGRSLPSVVGFAAKDVSRKLKLDLQSTTRTWSKRPDFQVPVLLRGDGFDIIGGTDDPVWNWLDVGTRPHAILPRAGGVLAFQWGGKGSYMPKSIPHWIGSQAGGSTGGTVITRRVWHPGTKPRKWSVVLGVKYAVEAPRTLLAYLEKWSLG